MVSKYDIIVIGGGHAGVEASRVCARRGLRTLLLTNNKSRIGYMSCNPSIGGLGKGHMVKELDAMGGLMGYAADNNCIQFKRLNSKKGPAVRGSRVQCDKELYTKFISIELENQENLQVYEAEAKKLIIENGSCLGLVTDSDEKIYAQATILCTGTFMKGVMHIGLERIEGGRVGDKATFGISDQLASEGFLVNRLKTGTPPRLDSKSIDWSKTQPQSGDIKFHPFSYLSEKKLVLPQIDCYLTYTNEKTHEVIRQNLHLSPMYTGAIKGVGPRYCPSIEDKITRFSEKPKHQTFLEPEGLTTNYVYLQGISTSLPEKIQYEFLQTIPGLEKVKMLRPGYAVEYDYLEPTQMNHTLETKNLKNLFFAGQINGTSGYEEAAVQGFVAGVNASNLLTGGDEFVLSRSDAYIGVLIDDLILKGTKEPYRMMTSRAEHRLHLREDNALERLSFIANDAGLLKENEYRRISELIDARESLFNYLEKTKIVPKQEIQDELRALGTPVLLKPQSLKEILRRVEINCSDLKQLGLNEELNDSVVEAVEIRVKYEGYIKRELELIKQTKKLDTYLIPKDIDYYIVRGLSAEEKEKLTLFKPKTLGQLGRLSGVNPTAVKAIVVYLKANGRLGGEKTNWKNSSHRMKTKIPQQIIETGAYQNGFQN